MLRFLGKLLVFVSLSTSANGERSSTPQPRGRVEYWGAAVIPGTANDTSGLIDRLEDGTPHNRMGGFGSGITYTGSDHTYLLVPDRGPADGATSYKNRMYFAVINAKNGKVSFQLRSTVMLTDEDGINFIGASSAIGRSSSSYKRFDPEGVRIGRNGRIFISDEYGPTLIEFSQSGHLRRRFNMPPQITVGVHAANPADELPPENLSGRVPNKGMEGLALSVDQLKLYGVMQSALIQDSKNEGDDRPNGTNVRIIEFDAITGQPGHQFLYVLDQKKNSLCEILAINETEFLVIERDGKAGRDSKYKRIYKIDLRGASDISSMEKLPPYLLPSGVIPVKKSLLIDMLNPELGIPVQNIPEKVEGLAFGPNLSQERRLLLIATDNDFLSSTPSYIYAFAVSGL